MEISVRINNLNNACRNTDSFHRSKWMFAGILNQFIERTKFNHLQGNKSTIIKQSVAGIAVQKGRFKSTTKAIKFSREFSPFDQTKARFKSKSEHIRSVLTQIKPPNVCTDIISLQCSSTLVQGFREFKPFRENLDITRLRYELPVGNNSFDKNSP